MGFQFNQMFLSQRHSSRPIVDFKSDIPALSLQRDKGDESDIPNMSYLSDSKIM